MLNTSTWYYNYNISEPFCRKNYSMILPEIMFWIGCAVTIVGIILRLYSEKILENNFKTQYKEYKKNTKRIIPFIW
ncbi:hypothetical protein [Clostridium beijerinckii]|uniref:hypothetical protein n=2 Tax=Clostridium beijerinckii TaxID=1520 RepID=UPI00156D51AA|nr:hypothetical protein [Clostridium beijerinckii]NRX93189.1 protein-S-isoprenylcysteine O-methyltransferase Ste14 [Clostridium beijerinckii]